MIKKFIFVFSLFLAGQITCMQTSDSQNIIDLSQFAATQVIWQTTDFIELMPPLLVPLAQKAKTTSQQTLLRMIAHAGRPVIVKLYAPWCMPCKNVKPIIDQIAHDFAEKLIIIEVNVDKFPDIRKLFDEIYIPKFIYFDIANNVTERWGTLARDKMMTKVMGLIARDEKK